MEYNNTTPITQQEMYQLMEPIYNVVGGGIALFVLVLAFFLVVYPFTNRRIR